jgi:1,4-dihydroxy-2-naphthoate polyprenyltransferase
MPPPLHSRFHVWLLASRPKTLPASAAPVLVGTAVAAAAGRFDAWPALVALACALLIQVATNLANDYFDFLKGADTEKRIGPVRVVQAGLIPPATVRNAMIGVLAVTFLLGLYLVAVAGWPILAIGLASLACAVLYTAGPYPLAYVGLGDLFVFLFFGVAAVNGTAFVQLRAWSMDAFTASLPMGALSTAILVVNNYRDIDTDRETRKRTLAVRMGRAATRAEYALLLAAAYTVPLAQWALGRAAWPVLLPLASAPLAAWLARVLFTTTDGPALNRALAGTGRLIALYGALYAAGIVLAAR